MAWKSIINDHEQINTIYQVWGVLTGNLLSKLSILPPFTSRTGNPSQGFPGMLIDFTITNTTTTITSTTIILKNFTDRASDGQGQHCQSWRRPCRPGCPPSSWSKSPRRGRGGGGRLDKLAACCWSLGSLLVGDSKEIWTCASAILNSRFESHISYIYI